MTSVRVYNTKIRPTTFWMRN